MPVFGSMPNGVTLPNHPNFINQLAAAISTGTVGVHTPTAANNSGASAQTNAPVNNKKSSKLKPHNAQGSVPMDLENDNDPENTDNMAAGKPSDKLPGAALSLPDAQQLYLNGLMHTPPGYLYFPTAQSAAAAVAATTPSGTTSSSANSSNANAQMLLDPSAMMAAMQQMQHNYAAAGYVAATTVGGMPSDVTGPGMDGTITAGKY